ncbi:esterase-like activity of phytase family protein [Palleronia sp.]|uniref:esterase-like activity of phytase family protein n=1 Tax=Palleronia sp. TaxID=1940284 RepID=UPI0035C86A5D
MSGRLGALILALSTLAACASPALEPSGSWEWREDDPAHGGYSAIEVQPGGHEAIVLSDRGRLVRLRLYRGPKGRIARIESDGGTMLTPPERKQYAFDPEGIAVPPDQSRLFVSTEGQITGVLEYASPDRAPTILPIPETFHQLPNNNALEGLAMDANGALWTTPEDTPGESLPTYIFRGTTWQDGPALPRRGEFAPVGLDFDDTGRLYVLERDLEGILGFRTRVRRFTFAGNEVATEEELFATLPGTHDNLEGIAVWRDDAGELHLTMISDDNFFFFQKTQLVEYDLPN